MIDKKAFYLKPQERKVCVTKEVLDIHKCRRHETGLDNLNWYLSHGYQKISLKEFKKLLN